MPLVKTPNGGLHVYFRQPNGEALGNGRGSLPPGIDVRGAGGFVVGPGARLPDGRGWTAVAGRSPIHDAPPMPQWLVAMLRPPQREEAREPNNTETSDDRGRAYAMAALDGVEAELAAAPTGERNERLYKTAFRLATMAARGWLMESEIIETLVRACEGNQYLREHGHRATMKTIESGIARWPQRAARRSRGSRRRRRACGQRQGRRAAQQQQRKQKERQQRHARSPANGTTRICRSWTIAGANCRTCRSRCFRRAMHRWMLDAARGAGVTVGHIALPLIGIASGLIGVARRVQATRSWQQPMTCWTCLVGVSGSGKTPSLDVVKRALSVVERSRQQENTARQLAHETRVERAKAALKKWKDDVAAAVDAGQPPPVKPAEAQDVRPFVVPRLYVSDCTIERLAPLLEARPRGVTYVADELARLFHEPGALQRRFGSRVLARGVGRQQLHRGTSRPPAGDIASPSRRRRRRFPAGLAGAQFCR